MTRKSRLTVTILSVIIISVLLGFLYDVIMTAFEKREYPQEYLSEINTAHEKYGVPKHIILAVIKTESDFDANAESAAGAMGLMQLMPETFTDMSGIENVDGYITDPNYNIDAGVHYLAYLYDMYGGEMETVYAAYNAGPGNVNNWLKDPEYSSDGKTLDEIPFSETKAYVRKVSSAAKIYKRLYFT